jgi:hypothetical protein
MRRAHWFALVVAVFVLASPPLGANAATPSTSIVMHNLNNPRGLNFGANGALYVAEAGRGGDQACFTGPDGGTELGGRTGSISRLWRGGQQRIVTGLASHAAAGGFGALGPHDVVPIGGGSLNVTIGLGTNPANRANCEVGKDFGWLIRAKDNGSWRKIADLAGYEANNNPDGGVPDSDPYGLLAPSVRSRGNGDDGNKNDNNDENGNDDGNGQAIIATDAGGNSLLAINGKSIRALATFPSRSSGRFTDAVPTSVARGPDGTLYVGELTGAPFVPGTANVYRIGKTPLTGFSFVVDITFGPDGSLYVLEFASGSGLSGPGNLWRVNPATPTGTRTLVTSGLVAPTSVTIGRDGAFYISNCGVFPAGNRTDDPPPCQAGGGGHVLRVKV